MDGCGYRYACTIRTDHPYPVSVTSESLQKEKHQGFGKPDAFLSEEEETENPRRWSPASR